MKFIKICFNSLSALLNFVLLSQWILLNCPVLALKRIKAKINKSFNKSLDVFTCIALVVKHANKAPSTALRCGEKD